MSALVFFLHKNLYFLCGVFIVGGIALWTGSFIGATAGYLLGIWISSRHDNILYRKHLQLLHSMSRKPSELHGRDGKGIGG